MIGLRDRAHPELNKAEYETWPPGYGVLPDWAICFTIRRNRGRIHKLSRILSLFILVYSLLGCKPAASTSIPATVTPGPDGSTLSQREYDVHQRVALVNEGSGAPEKQNIWIALIGDFPPYQEVKSMEISPIDYQLVIDEYGNHYAEFDFSGQPGGSTRTVDLEYRVVVNELAYDLSSCQGELLNDFIKPEVHIESANPQIVSLADHLAQGKDTLCEQVRAFYDYIDKNLTYTLNGENWGAQAALGPMGADCTEYTDLLVALSRSRGIPARYFEGLLYLENGSDSNTKIEHAWPDVYLPSVGWTALDPTLGRVPANHVSYFAHYTPDHIIVTLGVNPSVLRGSSYWTHLYWPGDSTKIQVEGKWQVELAGHEGQ